MKKPNIIIIGGGLAGLTNAILLANADFEVTLIERKKYPFHRVCGEYISNEALPFLQSIGFKPDEFDAAKISNLVITAPNGKALQTPLDLGAFGLSRYTLDQALYQIAKSWGVKFLLEVKVLDVAFSENSFEVVISDQKLSADLVIGAYGKRANLDQKLGRKFFYRRSPYIGVKYHIKTDFPKNTIQLDNFKGGYCGISKIENDLYCLCYLAEQKLLKQHNGIAEMESRVLQKNPHLHHLFNYAEFVWDRPETIGEISFEEKTLVENHLLMCGDTAGMIAPLCGNGMAMAFHGAKILSAQIIRNCKNGIDPKKRAVLEQAYQLEWNKHFAQRLKFGRNIQRLFGNTALTNLSVMALKRLPDLTQGIVKKTHGKSF